jgi:tRNA(Arg) A34 adenosine deaminase TadA
MNTINYYPMDMITIHNRKFDEPIRLLKKIAVESIVYYKHAAALMSGDTVYSFGVNKFIKEIKINNQIYHRTMHAEINVFEKLPKKKVRGMDILVIRINKNLALKNSRPCNQCIGILAKLGIRKVYYSNEDGNIVWEFVEQMEKTHISSGTKHLFCIDVR